MVGGRTRVRDDNNKTATKQGAQRQCHDKRTYSSPLLRAYGDLGTLTKGPGGNVSDNPFAGSFQN